MEVNLAHFEKNIAYIVGLAEPPPDSTLKHLGDLSNDLQVAKQGLILWGFKEEEISVFDDCDDIIDFCGAEKARIENFGKPTLVFLLYKGHSTVENDCVHSINGINLEGFCRSIAKLDNVYVVAVFDCCMRQKSTNLIEKNLDDIQNLICIYRDECLPLKSFSCSCEHEQTSNLTYMFFTHLSIQRKTRKIYNVFPDDIVHFKIDHKCLINFVQPSS